MAIFRREPPNGWVECMWDRQKSRFWAYIWLHCLLLRLQQAMYCHLSTRSPVDHGHRSAASCDTSLVVSGGVDCGRRRKNVYDKKPQRYAKDNRTPNLTARSDKSVAYVLTIKDYLTRRCTIKANYWQTRSIERPLCDSRATFLISSVACFFSKYRINLRIFSLHNKLHSVGA